MVKTRILLILALGVAAACNRVDRDAQLRMTPSYDSKTGKLDRLIYDSNGDGKADMWSRMNGTRIVTIGVDEDFDGTPERWEYYDANEHLEKVGFSRLHDGIEDAWTYADASGAISRVEISTRRDRHVERVERYVNGTIATADEDSDGDGRVDKWEVYEGGHLTSVALDTTGRGTPDRRLIYAANGTTHLEIDRQGRFVPTH